MYNIAAMAPMTEPYNKAALLEPFMLQQIVQKFPIGEQPSKLKMTQQGR